MEKIFPYRKDWNVDLGDFWTDIIQTLIVLPFVAKFIEIIYVKLNHHFAIQVWSQKQPMWLQAILVILSAEFLFYWYHRFSHTNKFLIKYHAVHHGALRVYWANAGRFHFVDLFFQFSLYFIPVYLFGANPEVAAIFLTLNAITGTLEHTNIDFKTVVMSRIFNTAELHRIHHSKKINECNSNYGKILSIWDTIFGTYLKPKFHREELNVGLPGGRPVPHDFWGQIMYPFQKKK
jgi:sterol desaturase/sphingolipid hydroxylase (fatty acid hydroxylase superfamily)